MTIYEFPKDGKADENQPKEKVVKEPEIIIIDSEENSREDTKIHPQHPVDVPSYVRIVCLLVGMCSLLWAGLFFFISTLIGAIAACFLFNNEDLNKKFQRFWGITKFATAMSTGFLIAVISPNMGFILILTYMVLLDEKWKRSKFTKKMRSHIETYMS